MWNFSCLPHCFGLCSNPIREGVKLVLVELARRVSQSVQFLHHFCSVCLEHEDGVFRWAAVTEHIARHALGVAVAFVEEDRVAPSSNEVPTLQLAYRVYLVTGAAAAKR